MARAQVAQTDLVTLEKQARMAHQVIRDAGRFKIAADGRLARPRAKAAPLPTPVGTDWSWRPAPWQSQMQNAGIAGARSKDSLTNEVVLFHDCNDAEVILRQIENIREFDLSDYGVSVEAFHFDGSYLSLVIEVPPESCSNLRKSHLIRLSTLISRERPTKIDARINLKHGPNVEQVLMTLPNEASEAHVEFDLAYSQLNETRAERMWIDLMIDAPAMNKITFYDLHLCRYPRAAI